MVIYCLDTSVIVEWLRNNELVVEKINKIQEKGEIVMTTITLCELYKGAYLSHKRDHDLEVIRDLAEEIAIYGLGKKACDEFRKEYVGLKKKGKITPEFDLMIASIVKANGLILVTKDKKHFGDLDVKVEVW